MTFKVRAPDGRVIELEQPIEGLVSTANGYATGKLGQRFSFKLARDGTALDEATTLQATTPYMKKPLSRGCDLTNNF